MALDEINAQSEHDDPHEEEEDSKYVPFLWIQPEAHAVYGRLGTKAIHSFLQGLRRGRRDGNRATL